MYIYIIRCNEYTKIGLASDLVKRMAALQVGNPYDLYLHDAYRFEHHSYTIEYSLHSMFKNSSKRGEWFMLSGDDFDKIRQYCIDNGGTPARDDYYKTIKLTREEKTVIADTTIRADIIRLLRMCVKYNATRNKRDTGEIYSGGHLRVNTDWHSSIVSVLLEYELVTITRDGVAKVKRGRKVSTLLRDIEDGKIKFRRRSRLTERL